jgi:hypothetical protein
MEDVLRDQAAVLFGMAKAQRKLGKALMEGAAPLAALGQELLAVADAMAGGAGMSQVYHPQPVNLNDIADNVVPVEFRDGNKPIVHEPMIVQDPPPLEVQDPPKVDTTFYMRATINQSEVIRQAVRAAARGQRVGLQYPDGHVLVLTSDNLEEVEIPHVREEPNVDGN